MMQHPPSAPGPHAAPSPLTDLERIGGLPTLHEIMSRLVNQMAQDVMIGFFFRNVSLKKLLVLETAYAQSHLGGSPYRGRDVATAHRALPIARGHFARRLQLLREALAWAQVPQDVQQRWLAHQAALMPYIVAAHTACPSNP